MQDMTPDPEGQKRIAQMIAKALQQPTHKERTMPKTGDTRAVREVKEAMAKAKAKQSKTVDKSVDKAQSIGQSTVSNGSSPEVSNEALHRQPIGHSSVSYNSEELYIRESIGIGKDKVNNKSNVLRHLEVSDFDFLIDSKMKPEQIEEALATLLPLFAAEGLTPTSKVLTDSILQLHRDTR